MQVGFPHLLFFCMTNKVWKHKAAPDKQVVQALSEALNVNHVVASLLILRGVTSFDEAKKYFRPSLTLLHDPYLMDQMDVAVDRTGRAIDSGEGIMIYGDYDVDGTTSVALVFDFLKSHTSNIDYYLPDRYEEGYGVSKQGVDYAKAHGYSLIICLDCGIKATENIGYAKSLGIDFIVCDHHLPGDELPDAVAILDPKKPACTYPYDELSGCGIGFKLIQGIALSKGIEMEEVYAYLDLVSISICADIVPITGENRILAYFGLRKLNQDPRPGVLALINVTGKKRPFNVGDVVFGIAPRINAAGRMRHAKEAAQLLLAKDIDSVTGDANNLNTMNSERKVIDNTITEEAIRKIEDDPPTKQIAFHRTI